jgi:general secretion pathway protein C
MYFNDTFTYRVTGARPRMFSHESMVHGLPGYINIYVLLRKIEYLQVLSGVLDCLTVIMKRFLLFINIVLITAISFLSVDTFYKIFAAQLNTEDCPKPIIADTGLNPAKFKAPPFSQYQAIVQRNIFQIHANNVVAAQKMIVENIKPTERNLKLWGTVVGDDSASAYAIIEEPGNNSRRREQLLYRNGDTVQGAEIAKILREKVILSANGKTEILRIVEPQSSGKDHRTGNAYKPQTQHPIRQRRILRSSQVQKAVGNIDTLMSQANIRSHSEGFQISRIRPSSIFRRMGLRNGDIITAVDSRPVNSVNDALDIWQELSAGGEISLRIKRRGRTRIIDYRVR